jgi:hypothetical protein
MGKPVNDEHALLCGMVWGVAVKHGVPMNPVQDGDGDYTDTFELVLPEEVTKAGYPVSVFLVVAPPYDPDADPGVW